MKTWIKGHITQIVSVVVALTIGVCLCFIAEMNRKNYKISIEWMQSLIEDRDYSDYGIYGIDALTETLDSIDDVSVEDFNNDGSFTVKVTYTPYKSVEGFDDSCFTELKENRKGYIDGSVSDVDYKNIMQDAYTNAWGSCFKKGNTQESHEFTFTVNSNGDTPKEERVAFIDEMLTLSGVDVITKYYNDNIYDTVTKILEGD